MKIDAVVFDLDGTLLNSKKEITRRTLEALSALSQRGVHAIFATARPPRAIQHLNLGKIGSMVYYNGAKTCCEVSGIMEHITIPSEITNRIYEFVLRKDPNAVLSVELNDRWVTHQEFDFAAFFKVSDSPILMDHSEIVENGCSKVLISNFIFYEELKAEFENTCSIVRTDSDELIQVSNISATKESAVAGICKVRGWEMKRVMCFGDDYNDLGLFKACGYSIAMGNAVPELMGIADEVTESNNDDGVAKMLEKVVFEKVSLKK